MDLKYLPKNFEGQLAHVVEECGEVMAAAGKTMRFGRKSVDPTDTSAKPETNEQWLKREILDLTVALFRLRQTLDHER